MRGPGKRLALTRWLNREIRAAEATAWRVSGRGLFIPKHENHYALGRAHALKEVRVKLVPVPPAKRGRR